jgi:hypothetical protein
MRFFPERLTTGPLGTRAVLRLLFLFSCVGTLSIAQPASDRFRGGKVEWTRLATANRYWDRHSNGDSVLLSLMRRHTALNIAREWRAVHANDLDALCAYPFVYAADASVLSDAEGNNLAEYLQRGGFLFIDACINHTINKDPIKFLERQMALLTKHWPEIRAVELDAKHEVFSIYFKFELGRPPTTRSLGSWSMKSNYPLRTLVVGDRVVGMISLSGLQCAWSGVGTKDNPSQPIEAMKMATNIYLYAMAR